MAPFISTLSKPVPSETRQRHGKKNNVVKTISSYYFLYPTYYFFSLPSLSILIVLVSNFTDARPSLKSETTLS